MNRDVFRCVFLCGLFLLGNAAWSANIGLADWCLSNNGDVTSACNGAGSGGNGINLSAFSTTLEPGANSLGSVTITLTPGATNFVAFYADYDVDYSTYGAFQDQGSVHGALPAGWSYELADPNVSNIFNDFASVTNSTSLPNTNTVGTASGPPNQCCDVSTALALTNIVVPMGSSETVTFTVSTTAPAGFYLEQMNSNTGDAIYLSATVGTGPVGAVPEPSTFVLVLGAAGILVLMFRGKRVAN